MSRMAELHAGIVQLSDDLIRLSREYGNYPLEKLLDALCRELGCQPESERDFEPEPPEAC